MKTLKLKIVFTLLVMLIANVAFAQTKEETIAWIKEKLEKHKSFELEKCEVVNISPCEICFEIKSVKSNYIFTYKFNPSASVWEVDGQEYIKAKSGKIIKKVKLNNEAVKQYEDYIDIIYLPEDGVPDIAERFAKALNHLTTFCEKKKETF